MAVMSGFKEGWREQILGTTPHITIYSYEPGGIGDYHRVAAELKSMEGIVSAGPFIEKQVMLSSESRVSGAVVKGVELDSIRDTLKKQVVAGNIDLLGDLGQEEGSGPFGPEERLQGGLFLGIDLAGVLNVAPGDEVTVISPLGTPTPMGIIPRMKKYRLVGIFQTGTAYDSALAYMSLENAQSFFAMRGKADGIQVRVEDIFQADRLGRQAAERLGYPYWSRDWKEANKALFAALRWEKLAMFIILALMVLVAAFSIVSTLVMMVMKKTKDIGILKSMGASRRSIMKIFIIQGMIIGTVGTGIGAAAGLLISKIQQTYHVIRLDSGVYGLDILPINIEYWWGFAFVCIVALALTFLATVYPSRRAAGVDPVEALRYE
jgi:lipoprotein-releasing system permease protein